MLAVIPWRQFSTNVRTLSTVLLTEKSKCRRLRRRNRKHSFFDTARSIRIIDAQNRRMCVHHATSHPPEFVLSLPVIIGLITGLNSVYRRKLNRAWDTLRTMPMPAIASDRLVDLHNDLTHYDTTISKELREFLRGNPVNRSRLIVDAELEEALRTFKAESPAEVECRRDLLRYKRRIDDVVRELLRMIDERAPARR